METDEDLYNTSGLDGGVRNTDLRAIRLSLNETEQQMTQEESSFDQETQQLLEQYKMVRTQP